MSEPGSRMDAARRWSARLLALLVLAAAVVAVLVVVHSVHAKHDVTETEATGAMSQLASANQALSSQLNVLKKGESPKPAQSATRSALALTRKLSGDLDNTGDLGTAVHAVFAAEVSYLDAVGSSLNNPHSVLLAKTVRLASAVRTALQSAPNGSPQTVSGATTLIAYSHGRNRR
ncbi:MAG: hypothetical protein JWM71_829 [Solirubrobacteraceae bacterium]|nr:hypothetical protein [Solirubrobacteraceae bacterium]